MNLTSPSQVKSWCIGNGFHPSRALGQNFLIDRNTLDAIVEASGVRGGERVLEIGPGLGVLTEALLQKGAHVTAIEKDPRLAEYLREEVLKFESSKVLKCEGSKVRECEGSKVRECEGSKVLKSEDSKVRECESSKVLKCEGSKVLKSGCASPPEAQPNFRTLELSHFRTSPPAPPLRIIEADALGLPLDDLFTPPFDRCVSNLPYSVGTRILLDIARHPRAPRSITVLVQTEVADRLAAGGGQQDADTPGCARRQECLRHLRSARGQAGVWLQLDYDVTLVRKVRASCFWPRPEVGSAIVHMDRHPCPLSPEERDCFETLTHHAFMHRRKQIGTALRGVPPPVGGGGGGELARLFDEAGIDARSRPETLSNGQWIRLAQVFCNRWPSNIGGRS